METATEEPKRANQIELKPCIGVVIGTERDPEPMTIEWDQDEIWCNGKRIGHVSHASGAVPRIYRVLSEHTKKTVLADIQQRRKERGLSPCADVVACLPDPKAVKRALNSVRRSR